MDAVQVTRRNGAILWQVALGAGLLLAWQALVSAGLLDPFFFSQPTAIAARVWRWVVSGFLYGHLSVTLLEACYGLVLGALLGVVAGFLLARSPVLDQLLSPYVRMLNAMPRVVLAPIFLLWFGVGIWSKVALAVTLVFFVVFFNTYQGVRDVDAVVIDNARMLGASPRQLVRHVLAPSARRGGLRPGTGRAHHSRGCLPPARRTAAGHRAGCGPAARMGLEDLAQSLDQRFRVLTVGPRTSSRHRSLQAVLD